MTDPKPAETEFTRFRKRRDAAQALGRVSRLAGQLRHAAEALQVALLSADPELAAVHLQQTEIVQRRLLEQLDDVGFYRAKAMARPPAAGEDS